MIFDDKFEKLKNMNDTQLSVLSSITGISVDSLKNIVKTREVDLVTSMLLNCHIN